MTSDEFTLAEIHKYIDTFLPEVRADVFKIAHDLRITSSSPAGRLAIALVGAELAVR